MNSPTNNSAAYEDALLQYHTKLNVGLKPWISGKTDIKYTNCRTQLTMISAE